MHDQCHNLEEVPGHCRLKYRLKSLLRSSGQIIRNKKQLFATNCLYEMLDRTYIRIKQHGMTRISLKMKKIPHYDIVAWNSR